MTGVQTCALPISSKREAPLKMRYPIRKEVNPLEDDEVDRAEVEVWQHMELTVTNRVRA